ncbi:MAG: membrane protein insertase YidC [Herbaspirillum sp.]
MDIKRTVLWVVFSLSLLLLWDNWMRHTGNPSMFFPTTSDQAANHKTATTPTQSDLPQASGTAANSNVTGTPAATTATNAVSAAAIDNGAAPAKHGQIITITTDIVKADIDTLGGELVRLELLKHRDTLNPKQNLVLFDDTAKLTYLGETGLIGGPFPNHKSTFVARPGPRTLDGNNQVKLVLDAEQGGVKLTKTYTFSRDNYSIDIQHTVTNLSGASVSPSLYLQLTHDGNKPEGDTLFYSTFLGPAVYTDADKYQKITFAKIKDGKADYAKHADNGWIAMVQHYFVSAFIPQGKVPHEIYTKQLADNLYAVGTIQPLGTIAPQASKTVDTLLYSGPQTAATLVKVAPGLELVRDYGWLTIIAKPIFDVMTFIHSIIGNWGWTIILLTLMIKLVFFPLSAASYRSMARMKQVTPKMQAIRTRHKGDAAKMNQEMMSLYKTEKINPLGGCLPIVVQIPVFLSLYWVLLASVEMRNAPWIFWIHDLASPDPFYILPVLMAVSMFVQTKLNPTPPDPIQAKVMMFMPIAFSVMFFFFPAGLVLYWVVNNILSIAQQWAITHKMGVKVM